MKYLSVLVLAVAFSVSSAEAGCRGGLLGGKLRSKSCGSSCKATTSGCGIKLLHGRSSCGSGGCSTAPAKSTKATETTEAPKGAEKAKVVAPSTK